MNLAELLFQLEVRMLSRALKPKLADGATPIGALAPLVTQKWGASYVANGQTLLTHRRGQRSGRIHMRAGVHPH